MGEHIGRYELTRLLGVGGQGLVYEAVARGPGGGDRRVAVKVLHHGDGLVREAHIGGSLRHANLVDVYEVGEDGGRWYCAMELCPGGPLSARAPLPPRAVVDVGLQVCDALAYAHDELGLVHLDLKPQNLLLHGAVVKVADLGLARAQGFGDGGCSSSGTPGFRAPEQVPGGTVDTRSDVYALGVTLAALATGRLPSASVTFGPDDDIVPPAEAPPWLAPIVDRCTRDDPDERFQDLASVAAALRGVSPGGPCLADHLGVDTFEEAPQRDPLGPSPDAFVGRAVELVELAAALADTTLVVLKGPAGVGKTRLAREVARAWRFGTGKRVAWVPTAGIREVVDLLPVVAGALDMPLQGADPAVWRRAIGHALLERGSSLLVLDGGDAGATAEIGEWIAAAPGLRVLITCRERGPAPCVVELGPLPEADAIALIATRAADRGVAPDPDAFAAIARRLDGLPLALELAAGRLGVIRPSDLVERLSLSWLRGSSSGQTTTLRGALAESWDLLDPVGREALAATTVFRSGFTAEAFDAVTGRDGAVLQDLVDRSLIRPAVGDRFDLLSPVREYAAEHLEAATEAEDRHLAWFARLGTDAALRALVRHGGVAAMQRQSDERANLLAACRCALTRRGRTLDAARCLRGLSSVLRSTGPLSTVLELAEALLNAADLEPRAAAWAVLVRAQALEQAGQLAAAEAGFVDLAARARALGDAHLEALAVGGLGNTRMFQGAFEEGARLCAEAVSALRRLGDDPMLAHYLGNLAYAALQRGRLEEAGERFVEALEHARRCGFIRCEAMVSANQALLHQQLGQIDEARAACARALAGFRAEGNARSEAYALGTQAGLAFHQGDLDEAAAGYEAALRQHAAVGNRRGTAVARTNLAVVRLSQGRVAEAGELLPVAIALLVDVGDRRFTAVARGELARVRLAQGDRTAGLAELDAAEAVVRALDDQAELLPLLATRVEALVSDGDGPGADRVLTEMRALLEGVQPGSPLLESLARAESARATPGTR